MNRENVRLTLLNARIARTNEARMAVLLTGIHELLYYIAEEMGIFEDDEEDEENGKDD